MRVRQEPRVAANIAVRAVQAMSYDIPLVVTTLDGVAHYGRVTERVTGLPERLQATAGVRLDSEEGVIHLADVSRIERWT